MLSSIPSDATTFRTTLDGAPILVYSWKRGYAATRPPVSPDEPAGLLCFHEDLMDHSPLTNRQRCLSVLGVPALPIPPQPKE